MKRILCFKKIRLKGERRGVKASSAGFTLVEIMVVCAVIGILAGVVIPAMLTMLPNWRLKGAARDLYSAMQDTRLQAIKANRAWAIVFDPGPLPINPANSVYTICSDFGAGTGTVADWASLADNTVTQRVTLGTSGVYFGHGNVPAGQSAAGGAFPPTEIDYLPLVGTAQVLIFNANGTISSAGFVYLQNQDNTVYAVGTQASGVVMLRRWMGGTW